MGKNNITLATLSDADLSWVNLSGVSMNEVKYKQTI